MPMRGVIFADRDGDRVVWQEDRWHAARCTVCSLGDGPVKMATMTRFRQVSPEAVAVFFDYARWSAVRLSDSWIPAGCAAPPPLQVGDEVEALHPTRRSHKPHKRVECRRGVILKIEGQWATVDGGERIPFGRLVFGLRLLRRPMREIGSAFT